MRVIPTPSFAHYLGLPADTAPKAVDEPQRAATKVPTKKSTAHQTRVFSSTPFADAMGKALYAPARATAAKGLNSAETLAAQIIDAGKERRGEAVKPVATQPSEADVAAQRIINAGKRRRGEI
ncbi:MAG: hypothetical protein M3O74_06805 [Pseudomonadota bacterium]|nr:hypothetical protein [Pseudomonadota bacterium]